MRVTYLKSPDVVEIEVTMLASIGMPLAKM